MADPTYLFTVNGTERPLRLETLSLQGVVNGRGTMSCGVFSAVGAYRPGTGDTGVLSENGVPIFGGIARLTEETGPNNQMVTSGDIETRITFDSFDVWADRRYITITLVAGTTLKDALLAIQALGYPGHGSTLDPAQATGPTLTSDVLADAWLLTDLFNTLSTLTGYQWEIDASNVWRFYDPLSLVAPINFIDGDGHAIGDIRVSRSRDKYVNRVYMKGGTDSIVRVTDTFVDGVDAYPYVLTYPIAGPIPYTPEGAVGLAYVTHDGVIESIGGVDCLNVNWHYDIATDEITRIIDGPPTGGVTTVISYDVQYPITVIVEDAAEVAAHGPYEAVFEEPNVFDKKLLIELANAQLAISLAIKLEASFDTLQPGLREGQTLTFTCADRNVSGTFMVTEFSARTEAQLVRRTLTLVGGTNFRGSFRDLIKAWLGTSGASATAATGPPVGSGGGGTTPPGPPLESVQSNQNSAFTGDAAFLFKQAQHSIICGDGCSITAAAFESCQVWGQDCHIADV